MERIVPTTTAELLFFFVILFSKPSQTKKGPPTKDSSQPVFLHEIALNVGLAPDECEAPIQTGYWPAAFSEVGESSPSSCSLLVHVTSQ